MVALAGVGRRLPSRAAARSSPRRSAGGPARTEPWQAMVAQTSSSRSFSARAGPFSARSSARSRTRPLTSVSPSRAGISRTSTAPGPKAPAPGPAPPVRRPARRAGLGGVELDDSGSSSAWRATPPSASPPSSAHRPAARARRAGRRSPRRRGSGRRCRSRAPARGRRRAGGRRIASGIGSRRRAHPRSAGRKPRTAPAIASAMPGDTKAGQCRTIAERRLRVSRRGRGGLQGGGIACACAASPGIVAAWNARAPPCRRASRRGGPRRPGHGAGRR